MNLRKADNGIILLVTHSGSRDFLVDFLGAHEYLPRVVGNPHELLQILKEQAQPTVFVDCQTVTTYGHSLFPKMKVACAHCRVVLLCDKSHQEHRDLVREAMELGIYACLQAPIAEWEILAMVRRSQAVKSPVRRTPRRKERH
jgi:DNA-binding NtrC family response regulator